MEITAYMFGVPLFTYNGSLEVIDEGLQYKVLEWQLVDMKKYNSLWTVIRPDGFVEIYNEEGELIYKDFLIHSEDFVRKLKNKIMFDEAKQRKDYCLKKLLLQFGTVVILVNHCEYETIVFLIRKV